MEDYIHFPAKRQLICSHRSFVLITEPCGWIAVCITGEHLYKYSIHTRTHTKGLMTGRWIFSFQF